jgi:hypothetical protein
MAKNDETLWARLDRLEKTINVLGRVVLEKLNGRGNGGGEPKDRRRSTWEEYAKAKELYGKGQSLRSIARELGRAYSTVYHLCHMPPEDALRLRGAPGEDPEPF